MDDHNQGPQPRRWVVLIQKAPHGPLTREEIVVLMEQKVLRHNDVAILIDPTRTEKSGWKFLWQFEEFDRRLPKPGDPPGKPPERRKEPPKISPEAIPADLREIGAEELILKSRNRIGTEREIVSESPVASPPHAPSSFLQLPTKGIAAAISLVVVVGLYFTFRKSGSLEPPHPINNGRQSFIGQGAPTSSGPLSGVTPRNVPRALSNNPRVSNQPIQSMPSGPPPTDTASLPRENPTDRGEIRRGDFAKDEPVFTEADEVNPEDELTEQDIIDARAFKAKRLRNKHRRTPAAAGEEEEEQQPDFPAEP